MTCTAQALVEAARCFAGLPRGTSDGVLIYLLCAWANGGAAPEDQGYLILENGSGGGKVLLEDGGKILIQV